MSMLGIPDAVVNEARWVMTKTLTDTCQIGTIVNTTDAYGATKTATTWSTAKPCRVDTKSAAEVINGTINLEYTHAIYLPYGTNILSTDVIKHEGRTYTVEGLNLTKTARVLTTVFCVEVANG